MTGMLKINTGAAEGDGTGDHARVAFDKVNANFGALSTLVQAIPAAGGQFTQAGTGSVQRTMSSKLLDAIPHVNDFGATGGPDDTAAINAGLAVGGVIVTKPTTITGTVVNPGYTTANPVKASVLMFGPGSGLNKSGAGALTNQGFLVGLGAANSDGTGLWKLQDPRFTELYSSAVAGHSTGDFNGVSGSAHQNGQNGMGFPCATIGYGLLTDPGNVVFGVFGRAEQQSAGVSTNEFNTFNFFGDPDNLVNGFPSRAFNITKANPVTLTVACGGTERSTCAIQITREGTPTNGPRANYRVGLHIDNTTDYGIKINGNGKKNLNDGNGSPTHGVFIYTGPDSLNGFCAQATGRVSDYGASNPYLLALSSNRNTDLDVSDPANTYSCFYATVDATIGNKNFTIAGSTGDMTLSGDFASRGQIGFTAGQLFTNTADTTAKTDGGGTLAFPAHYSRNVGIRIGGIQYYLMAIAA